MRDICTGTLFDRPGYCLTRPSGGFIEEAALLFDQQQVAGPIDDGEVDFPVDGVAPVHAGPVHGVVDRILVGQAVGEDGEGLDLALRGAGDGEFAPAVGDDAGHGGPDQFGLFWAG